MVLTRNILGGLKVEQAFSRGAKQLSPLAPLREAIDLTLNTFQSDFPVCDEQELVGLLTHVRLVESLNRHGPDIPIGDVMLRDVEPISPDEEVLVAQRRLSELRIDALPVVQDKVFLGLITNRDVSEIFRLASIQADLVLEQLQAPAVT